MRYVTRGLVLFCLLMIAGGCATMADSVNAKGTGQHRIYKKDYSTVWSVVLDVVKNSKLQLVSENKGKGEILAQRGMSALSYGENVAIFIEKQGGGVKTRVEVVSKKTLSTTVFATKWDREIFKELDAKLK